MLELQPDHFRFQEDCYPLNQKLVGVLIAVLRLLGVFYDVLLGDKVTKCAGQKTSSKQDNRKADFPGVTNLSLPDRRH